MSFSSFEFSCYDFDLVDFFILLGQLQLSSHFIFKCHCVQSTGLLSVGSSLWATPRQDIYCPEMFYCWRQQCPVDLVTCQGLHQ